MERARHASIVLDTIGEIHATERQLTATCACGHGHHVDLAGIIARLGGDMRNTEPRESLRCGGCGQKGTMALTMLPANAAEHRQEMPR